MYGSPDRNGLCRTGKLPQFANDVAHPSGRVEAGNHNGRSAMGGSFGLCREKSRCFAHLATFRLFLQSMLLASVGQTTLLSGAPPSTVLA